MSYPKISLVQKSHYCWDEQITVSSGNSVFQGRTFSYVSDVCTLIVIIYMLMERMELELSKVVDSKNV